MKAENAAVRELLRKMEEQQKALLEQVDRLQRRLDGGTAADVSNAGPANCTAGNTQMPRPAAKPRRIPHRQRQIQQVLPPAGVRCRTQANDERYRDGIIIWQTPERRKGAVPAEVQQQYPAPISQYTSCDDTFTDHLGDVREVNKRNDITVNRSMFILGGYIFDERAQYSLTVWTSAGAASIVVAGNIGWQFNKRLTLTGRLHGCSREPIAC